MKALRSPIKWAGGKARLAKHILPLIPKHVCYVEPFCGGLGLFLAKEHSRREVLNDLNEDLVGFYRQVKFHEEALLKELAFELSSRLAFENYLQQPGLTEIQRAARWFHRNKCYFGACLHSFAVGSKPGGAPDSSWENLRQAIRELHARLDSVVIECTDWRKCIVNHDRPETFFFFDPPYVGGEQDSYRSWTQGEMRELHDVLPSLAGTWVLTVNDSPANRSLFRRWKSKCISRPRGIANKQPSERQAYREMVVYSGPKKL